jgi:hypothetical protein
MPRAACLLATALFLLFKADPARASKEDLRLLFTGDILLSREVDREASLRKGLDPWDTFLPLFRQADWVAGNFEGAVGLSVHCANNLPKSLCFAVDPSHLAALKNAGFQALNLENNHSADLGPNGKRQTADAMTMAGLTPLTFEESPVFFHVQDKIVAVVPLTLVPDAQGHAESIPSYNVRQKILLAKTLSHLVVVSVHWGAELVDWPQQTQRDQARWLVRQGADLVIGHHPHVVVSPECVDGKPVYFSLGNLIFDQKYPITKQGLIADCVIRNERLFCGGEGTSTPENSSFPTLNGSDAAVSQRLRDCRPRIHKPFTIDGLTLVPWQKVSYGNSGIVLEALRKGRDVWRTQPTNLLGIEAGPLQTGSTESFLITLETHYSSIDKEAGPRPYVYRISEHGLVALWRGSALAWPTIETKLFCKDFCHLCVLHRGDSFLTLDSKSASVRFAVYDWDGFGFQGNQNPSLVDECRRELSL